MVDLSVRALQELRRLEPALLREREHGHAVERLDGPLPFASRHDRVHLVAAGRQLLADRARGAPESAVLAPGEDLDADQADSHRPPPPPAAAASSEYCSGAQGYTATLTGPSPWRLRSSWSAVSQSRKCGAAANRLATSAEEMFGATRRNSSWRRLRVRVRLVTRCRACLNTCRGRSVFNRRYARPTKESSVGFSRCEPAPCQPSAIATLLAPAGADISGHSPQGMNQRFASNGYVLETMIWASSTVFTRNLREANATPSR